MAEEVNVRSVERDDHGESEGSAGGTAHRQCFLEREKRRAELMSRQVTNSIDQTDRVKACGGMLRAIDIAPVIAESIRRTHNGLVPLRSSFSPSPASNQQHEGISS